jgi:hypothetical protein
VVEPFIKCMKMVIEKGADPHLLVQKLKKFREIDEEKRKLAMIREGQSAAEA